MIYDPPGAHGEHIPTGTRDRPGTVALANHLLATHGGTNLGIYNNRKIRAGHTPSVHAVSRAFDWGYPNRAAADTVLSALTKDDGALAAVFGVQAIHDYAVTHPDHRDLGRTWGHGRGWHWGHIGSAGGQWVHIELNEAAATDPQLMERLANLSSDHKAPKVPSSPAHTVDARRIPNPTLKLGSVGGEVVLLQTILTDWHRAKPTWVPNAGRADGSFGPRTKAALIGFQSFCLKQKGDGVYGPISHDALVQLAQYLESIGTNN